MSSNETAFDIGGNTGPVRVSRERLVDNGVIGVTGVIGVIVVTAVTAG